MSPTQTDISMEQIAKAAAKIKIAERTAREFREKPPTIAVIGLSGTGKSSTLNALFGQRLPVSHSIRGTAEFELLRLEAEPKENQFGKLPFVFMDAPGLGEDLDRDPEYLAEYEKHLPECDVILWVLSARNRALALDQAYLAKFGKYADKIVLGVNQVDIVHPNDWDAGINLPSSSQSQVLTEILADRTAKLSKIVGRQLPAVLYSASHKWRLIELLNVIMSACNTNRRYMFDMLSHIQPNDFLPADLSKSDRNLIEQEVMRARKEVGRPAKQNLLGRLQRFLLFQRR